MYALLASDAAAAATATATTIEPVSAEMLTHRRTARGVGCARQKVEPRRGRARVATAATGGRLRVVLVATGGAPRVRRWPKLRPVEHQRRPQEVELRIETYPAAAAAARGSKHAREEFLRAWEMRLRDPRRVVPR